MRWVSGLWRSFRAWFSRGPTYPPHTFGDPDRFPIDTQRLARDLELEREAERLGKAGLPTSDATTITGVESKLIQVVEKARQGYTDWASQSLRLLNQDINSVDLAPLAGRVRQLDAEFEREASGKLNDWSHTLGEHTKAIKARSNDLTTFKSKNKIPHDREAYFPIPSARFLRYSILAALIVVEGVVNSFFFAVGARGGWLEGLFYAVAFAFMNVFMAWVYGRLVLPELFHPRIIRQFIGIVLTSLALVGVGALALLIAHYRQAVEADSIDSAATIAVQTFRNAPFDLQETHSILLFAFSVVFALIAIYDAFGLDDPIPGYGAVTRNRMAAVEAQQIDLEAVGRELSELKERYLSELENSHERLEISLRKFYDWIQQKIQKENRLKIAFSDVDNCADTLIRRFRDVNMLHRRKGTATPTYFSWKPDLPSVAAPSFDTSNDLIRYEEQKQILREVQREIPTIRARIQSSFNRHYSSITPVDEHFA